MRTAYRLIAAVALSLALWPISVTSAQSPQADWTILIYLDGDNNLERNAIDDFIEMAVVGSSAQVNVIVQFDRVAGYDARHGDWTGTLRFRVTQGMTPESDNALADIGELNMGDPQTLIDFVSWGKAAFPAQRTALVLWNHGDGWRTASFIKEQRKAICIDITSGGDALDTDELGQALAAVTADGASPLDLLAFDACLMAMVEVDAQVHPYARVRTASEETEPGTGYPFDAILGDLVAHPEWDSAQLGIAIVERYYQEYNGETQSVVDLGDQYATLIASVDQLAGALLAQHETLFATVRAVRLEVQQFYTHYVDLYDLAQMLHAAIEDADVRAGAQAVMDAVNTVTLREMHGGFWPGAHGISIYFPAQASGWDSAYSGDSNYLAFTASTRWDEYLLAYLDLLSTCAPDDYEPDDEPATASAFIPGDKSQRHSFCPTTDRYDWVAFQATQGSTFTISTSELDPYCDTVLRLYDVDGQTLLAQNDDGGDGWASLLEWTSPADGLYYLRVHEYFGRTGQDSGYTLNLVQQAPPCEADPYEPDDTPAEASALELDGPPQAHTFCPEDDSADWATLQAVAGENYVIATSQLGDRCDTVLALYDVDGVTLFATDDDGGGEPGASRLWWTAPADGVYLVRVSDKEARTGAGTGYELRATTARTTLRGKVQLQGQSTFSDTLISVQGTRTMTTTTAIDGTFQVTVTTPCTVTATHPRYLPARWNVPLTDAADLTLDPVTLLGGDINGDLEIDILDLAYVGAHFGTADSQADVNSDGLVDILDVVLVATNFGQQFPSD